MNTWADRIADCITDQTKRHHLKGIPIKLIGSVGYAPDAWYWLEWLKGNNN